MNSKDKSQPRPKPKLEKIKAVPDPGVSQRGSAHIIYPDLPPIDMSIDPPVEAESTSEPKKD